MKRKDVILMYAFCLYIIFATDSLVVGLNLIPALQDLSYIIIMIAGVALFGLLLMRGGGTIQGNGIKGLVGCSAFVIISTIVNFDLTPVGFIKIGCLIIGFYIANKLDTSLFIKAYVHIMLFISAFSLVIYFFSDFFVGLDIFPVYEGYKGQVFQLFGFSNLRISALGYRNWGPFWEPGVYQTYLLIAIIFLMFDNVGIKRKNTALVLLLVTLATTFSTTGFIAAPFIILAYILHKPGTKRKTWIKIAILVLVVGFFTWFLNSDLFLKVFSDKFENLDETGRNLTVEYGLKLWIKKPLFGYASAYKDVAIALFGENFGFTNTFIAHLVAFGTFVGAFFVYGIFMFANTYQTKLWVRLLIAIGLIISLSGESYIYSPMICFLLFYRNKAVTP